VTAAIFAQREHRANTITAAVLRRTIQLPIAGLDKRRGWRASVCAHSGKVVKHKIAAGVFVEFEYNTAIVRATALSRAIQRAIASFNDAIGVGGGLLREAKRLEPLVLELAKRCWRQQRRQQARQRSHRCCRWYQI